MYVPADQMDISNVRPANSLCFKVRGKWQDLHQLALQIKSRWVRPDYTVVLVAGKQFTDEPGELIISGNISLAYDAAYGLVEQRIEEGLPVEMVYGDKFHAAINYGYEEHPEPVVTLPEPDPLDNHPF